MAHSMAPSNSSTSSRSSSEIEQKLFSPKQQACVLLLHNSVLVLRTWSASAEVHIFDPKNPASAIKTVSRGLDCIDASTARVSPDKQYLVLQSGQAEVSIWKLSINRQLQKKGSWQLPEIYGKYTTLSWTTRNDVLVGTDLGYILCVDIEEQGIAPLKLNNTIEPLFDSAIAAIAPCPFADRIYAVSYSDGKVVVYDGTKEETTQMSTDASFSSNTSIGGNASYGVYSPLHIITSSTTVGSSPVIKPIAWHNSSNPHHQALAGIKKSKMQVWSINLGHSVKKIRSAGLPMGHTLSTTSFESNPFMAWCKQGTLVQCSDKGIVISNVACRDVSHKVIPVSGITSMSVEPFEGSAWIVVNNVLKKVDFASGKITQGASTDFWLTDSPVAPPRRGAPRPPSLVIKAKNVGLSPNSKTSPIGDGRIAQLDFASFEDLAKHPFPVDDYMDSPVDPSSDTFDFSTPKDTSYSEEFQTVKSPLELDQVVTGSVMPSSLKSREIINAEEDSFYTCLEMKTEADEDFSAGVNNQPATSIESSIAKETNNSLSLHTSSIATKNSNANLIVSGKQYDDLITNTRSVSITDSEQAKDQEQFADFSGTYSSARNSSTSMPLTITTSTTSTTLLSATTASSKHRVPRIRAPANQRNTVLWSYYLGEYDDDNNAEANNSSEINDGLSFSDNTTPLTSPADALQVSSNSWMEFSDFSSRNPYSSNTSPTDDFEQFQDSKEISAQVAPVKKQVQFATDDLFIS